MRPLVPRSPPSSGFTVPRFPRRWVRGEWWLLVLLLAVVVLIDLVAIAHLHFT